MLLPLRDAVRTSILSKKWRFYWLKLPQLVFDDTLIRDSKKNKISIQSKLHKTIYQVLLHHRGPIVKFTLSISELESCVWIYELIVLFLLRNCIRELTLYIQRGNSYRLPPALFSCPQLRELKLSNCIIEPPPTFNGFSRIRSLEFHSVYFAYGVLRRLVSSCPQLEQLKIGRNIDCGFLEIDAPNLKFLSINARFGSIHFKNVPLLAVVSITSNYDQRREKSAMIEVFRSLPVIETLQLGHRFVKFLTVGYVPEKLPFTLDHLKVLQLKFIRFGEIADVSFALCLIKSSPNLKFFDIEVFTSKYDATGVTEPVLEFLEMQDYSDISLNQLQELKMQFISGTRPELEFLKLILATSPLLERIIIEPNSAKVHGCALIPTKQRLRLRRRSRKREKKKPVHLSVEDTAQGVTMCCKSLFRKGICFNLSFRMVRFVSGSFTIQLLDVPANYLSEKVSRCITDTFGRCLKVELRDKCDTPRIRDKG
ncbi:F-box/FBD/LRR-repeat protein At1g13570-like [Cornus florida]|uniref:F-box/FBD/LRR-repeat protein At1g13570-like n=1 Tax=Cornus florida TaxID=4283 RepID=UPI00289A53B2|nr:F-box/FBD/LRR-repeat protein At1g13570-like [Cornus florida]